MSVHEETTNVEAGMFIALRKYYADLFRTTIGLPSLSATAKIDYDVETVLAVLGFNAETESLMTEVNEYDKDTALFELEILKQSVEQVRILLLKHFNPKKKILVQKPTLTVLKKRTFPDEASTDLLKSAEKEGGDPDARGD